MLFLSGEQFMYIVPPSHVHRYHLYRYIYSISVCLSVNLNRQKNCSWVGWVDWSRFVRFPCFDQHQSLRWMSTVWCLGYEKALDIPWLWNDCQWSILYANTYIYIWTSFNVNLTPTKMCRKFCQRFRLVKYYDSPIWSHSICINKDIIPHGDLSRNLLPSWYNITSWPYSIDVLW